MALISCPECSKEISDKAKDCPNCGYPLAEGMDIVEGTNIKKEAELPFINAKPEENSPKNSSTKKFHSLWVLIGIIIIGIISSGVRNFKEERELEKVRKEIASRPKSNISYTTTTQANVTTSKEKRETFASSIKQALNAPGLPAMCEDAYFNDLGELIIEVNGEWIILNDSLKKDMIYALKELLKTNKNDLGVEGFGQFFSTSGQPLESFYAK